MMRFDTTRWREAVKGKPMGLGWRLRRLRHRLLDDLEKVRRLLLRLQVRYLLVCFTALVIVEHGDLLHGGIEYAPARTHPGRLFFLAGLLDFGSTLRAVRFGR